MASAQCNSDQIHSQTEAKSDQCVESTNTSANSSVNKVEDAIQRARESAQQKREQQNSGFLHQVPRLVAEPHLVKGDFVYTLRGQWQSHLRRRAGEQMMHMAQGAVDGVKNTFGIGSNKNK